jgi:hypothetical protein
MTNLVESQASPGPSGIGGWLVLPVLGFIGTILLTLWNLFQADLDGLVAIFNATSGPLAALKAPTASSLFGGCLVILSASYCLYLIFAKNHTITSFATAHYLILASAGLVDVWAEFAVEKALPSVPPDPTIVREAARGIMIACIWIPYFHLSTRVKNTFVNVRASAPVARPAA